MKLASNKTLRWFAISFFSVCWAYALVTRFTGFFMAPRIEKILLLCSFFLVTGIFSICTFIRILPKITIDIQHSKVLRIIVLSSMVAVFLSVFIIPPLYFPEDHLLAIVPFAPSSKDNLTLVSIQRLNLPFGNKESVPPGNLDIQGGWQKHPENNSLTWSGEQDARISYSRFMQSGIEIIFETGPDQGQAHIYWDNQEFFLDLAAPNKGATNLLLNPALNWHRADPIRKVLVGFARIAEVLGLCMIFSIIFLILTKITFRKIRTIVINSIAILIILPLISAVDPVVKFQDSNLDAFIRNKLDQSNGDIHLHKLLTIVKIDASSMEITDLDGIQNLRKLESLKLRDNNITDITQLSDLTRLRELDLRDNSVNDITPLANLINLESLNLRANPIGDLSPLSQLIHLTDLNLSYIPLREVLTLLQHLYNLKLFNIRNCAITNISILSKLMNRGALQDDPKTGVSAQLDIRDNPIAFKELDGYASLRPYWERISERAPFVLPEFNTLDGPTFSQTGGFYEEDFWLMLSIQDAHADIHYTLDGSEPTRDSPKFNRPIHITNHMDQSYQISAISTISDQWKEPIGEVFKATVVRAKAFQNEGAQSATITHTYFVDPNMIARYSLPVISISMDPDYLFDSDHGIYVIGRKLALGDEKSIANYHQVGSEWERPVSIEYFDAFGKRLLAQNGGIRIHGSSIRKYPQKSFRLYADNFYDESDFFEYEFFPDTREAIHNQPILKYKTLILRNSGNDNEYPSFRDTILHTLLSHTTLDLLTYHPIVLFLNDEYWGIYNLRENLDEYFISSRYLIDPRDIIILERDAQINTGQPGDELHYKALLDYIKTHDINTPEPYNYISTQMDIDNFIDYQIAEIYSANSSWPHDNIKYWRYRSTSNQPDAPYGHDGRWRWLLFDLDRGFGYGKLGLQDNTLLRAAGDFLIRNLLENTTFRTKFINRFADHLNTSFAPWRVISAIDLAQSVLDPEIPEHIARWNIMENSLDIWDKNVDIMRTFANERPEYVRQHILEYFKLTGTASINLLSNNAKGYIRINSIDIIPSTPGVVNAENWNGIYFKGIPITVLAIPKPGFRFAGWDGIDLPSPEISFTLTEDISLKANFIPIAE